MKVQLVLALLLSAGAAQAQPSFAVASIRPSAESVSFESDGETRVLPNAVRMRDVTIETCIKWAYRVQKAQIIGPALLTSARYDITAKADGNATKDEMRVMMQSLLKERFQLAFHHDTKELRSFALVVARHGPRLKQAAEDEVPFRENYARGTVARAITMGQLADFLSDPVEKPVVDKTGLTGRWDFTFDFTRYLVDKPKGIDDYLLVLNETLEGEIGLKLQPERDIVPILVIDHVEKPSEN